MHRIYVISDLHLGGLPTPMLGEPEHLTEFLRTITQQVPRADETRELVINGDFVDFLAEPSRIEDATGRAVSASGFDAWTPKPADAVAKLQDIIKAFKEVFGLLGECARKFGRLTILLGNHDIELALPMVRARLLHELGISDHTCCFIDDNRAYRIGDVLIEHGNRYDPWNAIDYDGLRREASAASRGEVNPLPMITCPGSQLVSEVIAPLKYRYRFIDLLKPEDKIVSLLLLAIEPKLRFDLDLLFHAASNYVSQWSRAHPFGVARAMGIGSVRAISGSGDPIGVPAPLAKEFADFLVFDPSRPISSGRSWLRRYLDDRTESLADLATKGIPVPHERIRRLQVALQHALIGDRSFGLDDLSGPYPNAASRIAKQTGARVVIMGHTHLARAVPISNNAWYVNTGTWTDLIQCDESLLDYSNIAQFTKWVAELSRNELSGKRAPQPHYAEVVLNSDWHLKTAPAHGATGYDTGILKRWT